MDLFTLVAKLTLDKSEYEKGLNDAESEASSSGGKFTGILGKVGKAAGTIAKVSAAGIAAGSAVVGVLTKQSVEAYANYEQLVGGVETLFGAGGQSLKEYADSMGMTIEEAQESYDKLLKAQGEVIRNADEAYKNAGMSANEYMETVTSFSASLIQSLGGDTEKAATYADKAIVDMSDNANKMGTSMESIQNAYQGFAKQNYTMLDNLKLGYGGTKEEMERLITDAEGLNSSFKATRDENGNLKMSFAEIVDAIHIVQDNLGITGTTSKEAATTIEGSLNMTKAAWNNLIEGFADPDADLDQYMDNLIIALVGENEGEGLLNNLIPAVERALKGIGEFVAKAAPIIAERLPELIEAILPSLLEAATALVAGLVQALPTILQVLIDQAPMIISTLIDAIVKTLPLLVELGGQLIEMLWDGIEEAFPIIEKAWDDFWNGIAEALGEIWDGIVKSIKDAWENIKKNISDALRKVSETISNVWNKIKEFISTTLGNISTKFSDIWNKIKTTVTNVVEGVRNAISDKIESAKETVGNILDGIHDKFESVFDGIKKFVEPIIDWLKGIFDFNWSLPDIQLPHFQIDWNDLGFGVKIPYISVEWYRKAYENPYMFTQPTVVGNRGFGDGPGGEIVYGHESLMQDIKSAMGENTEKHLADIAGMLEEYLPVLSEMRVVLDSGKLVGAMTAEIDAGMGVIAARKRRGN